MLTDKLLLLRSMLTTAHVTQPGSSGQWPNAIEVPGGTPTLLQDLLPWHILTALGIQLVSSASGKEPMLPQHIVVIHCLLASFRKPWNVIMRAGEICLDVYAVFHPRGTTQFNGWGIDVKGVSTFWLPLTSEVPGFCHPRHLALWKCVTGPCAKSAHCFLHLQSSMRAMHKDSQRNVKTTQQTAFRADCFLGNFANFSNLEISLKTSITEFISSDYPP